MSESNSTDRGFLAFLRVTAVLSGAQVMVIEVLGSRVVGPLYGVSLFVWTSLITVTLIALAGGYAFGGLLADRRSSPSMLYGLMGLAGVLVLLVPLLKAPILVACLPLGLRAGSFVSTLLLFGPSLFLLGCVSPYLVKIATREMDNLGRTVGGLYALSTVGSVGGTLLTGFVFIGYLGVNRIFQVVGALLIFLAAIYFVVFARRFAAAALVVLPFLVPLPAPVTEVTMANGTVATVVAAQESHYGSIKVIDYRFQDIHVREMVIDGLIQGGVDLRPGRLEGKSYFAYSYAMEIIPRALHRSGKDCLVVGLGAGIITRAYEEKGVRTDVVEIDPEIVDMARAHFGFTSKGDVIIADARYFLATTDRQYDFVVLDAFTGDTTPTHLLSQEALGLAKARLRPGGVVALNIGGSLKHHTLMTASIVRTMKTQFEQVQIYPLFEQSDVESGVGNLVLVAHDGPVRTLDPGLLIAANVHPKARKALIYGVTRPFEFPPGTPAMLLTDDHNPLDFHDAWLKEAVRTGIIEHTSHAILSDSR